MTMPAGEIDVPRVADASPVLNVRGLCVEVKTERGWVQLVDDVSLTVAAGETVGLVGESGSGKTVTSLAVMQLLPPNARLGGSVLLNGRETVGLSRSEIDRLRGVQMGMIFQEPKRSLNPAFTVGDQVAESVRRHLRVSRKAAWARVVELFDLVGIADARRRARAYPHEFSGGMCQRVMLAVALACNPRLLIADEPTTALDATVQRQVLALIYELQKELGLGVLLITHDLGVVAETCDRVNVMYAGRIVEHADVYGLFDNPLHPYSAGLLHAMPDPVRHAKRMGFIPGVVPSAHEFAQSCRFISRCPYADQSKCASGPIPLTPVEPGHAVRCARAGDLDLSEAFL